jgi:hypothetical protein
MLSKRLPLALEMLRCKKTLDAGPSRGYMVRRSNAAPAALSAFLDVSSLNLAGPQSPAIFFNWGAAGGQTGEELAAARSMRSDSPSPWGYWQ